MGNKKAVSDIAIRINFEILEILFNYITVLVFCFTVEQRVI